MNTITRRKRGLFERIINAFTVNEPRSMPEDVEVFRKRIADNLTKSHAEGNTSLIHGRYKDNREKTKKK